MLKKLIPIAATFVVTAIVVTIAILGAESMAQDTEPGLPYNIDGTWTPEYYPVSDSEGNTVGVVKSADAFAAPVSADTRLVSSVHVVEVTTKPWLYSSDFYDAESLKSVGFGPAEVGPWERRSDSISALQSLSKKVERGNCRFTPPSLQVCDLVLKSTGHVVGTSQQTGRHQKRGGRFRFWYRLLCEDTEHPGPRYRTFRPRRYRMALRQRGRLLGRTGAGRWSRSEVAPLYVAGFPWDLFGGGFEGISSLEEQFDEVTRLPDEEFGGTLMARRYRAERQTHQGGQLTVDLWIDPETGFPHKIVRELSGSDGMERSTYLLSGFNEVELPEGPPPGRTGRPLSRGLLVTTR